MDIIFRSRQFLCIDLRFSIAVGNHSTCLFFGRPSDHAKFQLCCITLSKVLKIIIDVKFIIHNQRYNISKVAKNCLLWNIMYLWFYCRPSLLSGDKLLNLEARHKRYLMKLFPTPPLQHFLNPNVSPFPRECGALCKIDLSGLSLTRSSIHKP